MAYKNITGSVRNKTRYEALTGVQIMEQLKILDLINILLNFYIRKGNIPIYYSPVPDSRGFLIEPIEVTGVEKQDSGDTRNGEKIVIY